MVHRRHVIAAVSGNFVEWYDFALYLFLAPVLAKQFFPADVPHVALLCTFTLHAVSFFFRPLGAILFGYLGDVYGRCIALKLSLSCLAALSMVIAFLPSYQNVGYAATVLLSICRIGQGLCLGGEFAGSMIYLTESADPNQRAFMSSMSNNGSNLGVMLAASSAAVLSSLMTEQSFALYGYRILFFIGGVIGVLGFAFRSDLRESAVYLATTTRIKFPLLHVLRSHRQAFIQLFFLLIISALGSYALMGYVSTFLHESLAFSTMQALNFQTGFIVVTLIMVPIFGWIADRWSVKKLFSLACVLYLIVSLPCFALLYVYQQPLFLLPIFIIYSIEQATSPALMTRFLPVNIRYTGVSLAYNMSMAIIGGLAPLANQFFLKTCHMPYTIAYLLMGGSLIALCVLHISQPFYSVEAGIIPSHE